MGGKEAWSQMKEKGNKESRVATYVSCASQGVLKKL